MNRLPRIRAALIALTIVIMAGTAGYTMLGFTLLDAVYQTVTTITTVGFREVNPLGATGQVFTMVLILTGVGTALYTLGALLEAFIEGDVGSHVGRRRMDRSISRMRAHVIVCGWGRVGTASHSYLHGAGRRIVVVDRDPARLVDIDEPHIVGDVTDDDVLRAAGVDRASALIAALDSDADNVYVTLSARALNPRIVIVSRASDAAVAAKLRRAGADQTVNPELMGGRRMAAFALQPHVADFLDLVMHDEGLDYNLAEIHVPTGSAAIGEPVRAAVARQAEGARLLALRPPGGPFQVDPDVTVPVEAGMVLIALGTDDQLSALRRQIG